MKINFYVASSSPQKREVHILKARVYETEWSLRASLKLSSDWHNQIWVGASELAPG